jgi:hypothetical protein
MARRNLCLIAVLCIAGLTSSCNRELKPDHKGVFIAEGGQLTELKNVRVDSDFTPEGFTITYFTTEGPTTRQGDFYFILYGDYQVTDLKAYARQNGRWEIDTSKPGLNETIETLGMKGEKEMQICRFTKQLPLGTYALEAQQGGTTLFFPFTVSSGY